MIEEVFVLYQFECVMGVVKDRIAAMAFVAETEEYSSARKFEVFSVTDRYVPEK